MGAEAGMVVDEPFDAGAFAAALSVAQDAARRSRWSAAAERYGAQPFLYDGRMRAAEMILGVAAERVRRKSPGAAGAKPASGEVGFLHESRRTRGASSCSRSQLGHRRRSPPP